MKVDKTSRTAQYMAFFRALETKRSSGDKLFSDPFAIHFLDPGLKPAVKASALPLLRSCVTKAIQQKIPGAYTAGIARTKYIDDLVAFTVGEGIERLIILGAGFDGRASRLDSLQSIPVVEIDHPNTSNFKRNIYQKEIGALPQNVTYCWIGFTKQSLDDVACKNHFDFTQSTTIIWEGVTNYLTAEAVDNTFPFISKYSKGSYVIFTYVQKEILDKPSTFFGGENLLKDLDNMRERGTFGFSPGELPGYLSRFGLTLVEDLGATEYRQNIYPKEQRKEMNFIDWRWLKHNDSCRHCLGE